MNTLKWKRISVAVICLTLMLTLTIGNVNASPKQQSEMDFAAIDTLRLGWELLATRRLSLVLGAGGTAAYATSRSSLVTSSSTAFGFGGLGFLGAGWALGPGQIFGEVSWGVARVSSPEFGLDAGGAAIDVGYRIGVF